MKRKVLFTGKGRLILEDLMQHVPDSYEKFMCDSTEAAFLNALEENHPHVVVVCLSKCSEMSLRMYSELEADGRYIELPLIAIGNNADCDVFYKYVFQKNMKIFERPLNMEQFLQALEMFSEMSAEAENARLAKEKEKSEKKMAAGPPSGSKKKSEKEEAPYLTAADKSMNGQKKETDTQEKRKSILVVDDDVRMLKVIKMYLQDFYDVTVVPGGKLALKFLSKKHADLVLLDYMMPDMDGPSVLHEIRHDSPCPKIPVIFLTGVSEKDLVVKGLENHPDGYLLKPVQQAQLLEKVMEVLLGL